MAINKAILNFIIGSLLAVLCSCKNSSVIHLQQQSIKIQSPDILFSELIADGFDFPVGDPNSEGDYKSPEGKIFNGWYVATKYNELYSLGLHPGEDWNGRGGGNTDLGQPVYSVAIGKVIFAAESSVPWGNIVIIQHYYLSNAQLYKVYSLYAHLQKINVKKGDIVRRRDKIGTIGRGNSNSFPAHLHLEIRKDSMSGLPEDYWPSSHNKNEKWISANYYPPSDFILKHRVLVRPADEKQVIIVLKHKYQMHLYEMGKLKQTFEIALSQDPVGHKYKEGDNKLPEGEYKIIEKLKGPFDSSTDPIKAYLGSAWLRINYPNDYDASTAYRNKRITKSEFEKIIDANAAAKMPLKNTVLGGGIGIHGWIKEDWSNDSVRNLTWGCISMHNDDLKEIFNAVELKTKILILP